MKTDNLPAINWLVHVLSENIGLVTWPDILSGESNPKPICYPIPPGKTIVLRDSREYRIDCDSEETRNLIIELAKRHKEIERENYRLSSEKRYDQWISATEVPDPPHSSHRRRIVFVTSPILHYIVANGVCFGYEDNGWNIVIEGKVIPHSVTHWRHLPPAPQSAPSYEDIKDQVEALKKAIGRK
jgi:hypothetical protein